MADLCGDNRFDLIEKYKQKLIDETNIESSPDEMKVLDNILFRFWQMGWLDKNMVEDVIFRKAAVDVIHKYFAERIEQSPMHKTVDGEVYDLGICNPLLADNKALSQAIKELPSALPTRSKMEQVDLIDRQAAIDAALDSLPGDEYWDEQVCKAINKLPPAQPLLNQGQPRIQSSDCISRQAVIDAIVAWTVEDRPDIEMPTDLIGRIEALPSAQPDKTYERGWKEGREALREETWEYVRDRFD